LVALAAAAIAAGCGNLTSGGFGGLEVLVAADSVVLSSAEYATAAVVPVPGRSSDQTTSQLEGRLVMRIMVFAMSGRDDFVEVTSGVREIVLPLSGGAPSILTRKELPAGRYLAIRTVFLQVEAVVESGLVDPDGQPVRGAVRVELGPDARLVVDTPIDLTISEGRDARIKVDLHTQRWIRLLNAQRQVQSSDFVGQLRVGRQP
jgi:hypothetical protein